MNNLLFCAHALHMVYLINKNVSDRFVPQLEANDYCALYTVTAKKTYSKELGQVSQFISILL